jgi:Tfp pilus assembly protein PilO
MDIREKISSLLEKIDGNNRYYVLVGFMALVFLLDYFVLMNPQLAALKKINPEIKAVSDSIKSSKGDMKQLNAYQSDLEELTRKFEEANLKVKSRDEVPIILEHIANIANEFGVKIDQIMPDSVDQDLLTENSQRKYYDLPIYMEARSGYHNLGRFLDNLSKGDISLRIGAITVVATNDTRYHLVKLTFRATIYEEVIP